MPDSQSPFQSFQKRDNDIDVLITAEHVTAEPKAAVFVADHDDKEFPLEDVGVVS